MCKIVNDYKGEIEQYCMKNGLNSKKVFGSPRCYDNSTVFLQHVDPEKGKKGLLDETPAPVILKIFKTETGVTFEQTEYTQKYLAI